MDGGCSVGLGRDAVIAELAGRQHGVVTRSQLLAHGIGRGAIDWRVGAKRLHVVHQGVYAVGYRRLTQRGWWMAAVLACGPDAVLSHRAAAVLWGILEGDPARADVTVPCKRRGRAGIRLHRAVVAADERTVHAGIPVTTVARTLLDLAAVLQLHELRRALERAEALGLADRTPLAALVDRHRGRRGIARLRVAIGDGVRRVVTRSELERRFLSFLEQSGLPRPETNVRLDVAGESMEVDCVWREQRVIAELDSRAWHLTAEAFERDRERDRRAQAAGWRPIRITARALAEEPSALVAVVRALLSPAAPARSA
jgi:very-short-patch-repair endonuclease